MFNLPILHEMENIKDAQFIKAQDESVEQGILVIQTKDEIWTSENFTGIKKSLTEGLMAPVTMQRGYNSILFYVKFSENRSDAHVFELSLLKKGQEWNEELTEIHVVREGTVLALQIDSENRQLIDSSYTYGNKLKEYNYDATNMIYLMDDKENLLLFSQKTKEIDSRSQYEITKEISLSEIKGLSKEISRFKKRPFNHIAVTDRVITIND